MKKLMIAIALFTGFFGLSSVEAITIKNQTGYLLTVSQHGIGIPPLINNQSVNLPLRSISNISIRAATPALNSFGIPTLVAGSTFLSLTPSSVNDYYDITITTKSFVGPFGGPTQWAFELIATKR